MLSHEKPQSIRTFKEKQEFSFPITSVIFGLHLFKRAKMLSHVSAHIASGLWIHIHTKADKIPTNKRLKDFVPRFGMPLFIMVTEVCLLY